MAAIFVIAATYPLFFASTSHAYDYVGDTQQADKIRNAIKGDHPSRPRGSESLVPGTVVEYEQLRNDTRATPTAVITGRTARVDVTFKADYFESVMIGRIFVVCRMTSTRMPWLPSTFYYKAHRIVDTPSDDGYLDYDCRRYAESVQSVAEAPLGCHVPHPLLQLWCVGQGLWQQDSEHPELVLDGEVVAVVGQPDDYPWPRTGFLHLAPGFDVSHAVTVPLGHADPRNPKDRGAYKTAGKGGWALVLPVEHRMEFLLWSVYLDGSGYDVDSPSSGLWAYVDGRRCADGPDPARAADRDYVEKFNAACNGKPVEGLTRECYGDLGPGQETPVECPPPLLSYNHKPLPADWLPYILRAISDQTDAIIRAINGRPPSSAIQVPADPSQPFQLPDFDSKLRAVQDKLQERFPLPKFEAPSETCGRIVWTVFGRDVPVLDTCSDAVRRLAAVSRTAILALIAWILARRVLAWYTDAIGAPRF